MIEELHREGQTWVGARGRLQKGKCEGARLGAVPGTPACCTYCRCCLKTFHFHLKVGSLPHNLHFCSSPWCYPGPSFLGGSWRGCSAAVRYHDVLGTQEQRNYDSLEALGLQPCPAFSFSRAWMDNTKPYSSPVLDFLGPYGKRAEG